MRAAVKMKVALDQAQDLTLAAVVDLIVTVTAVVAVAQTQTVARKRKRRRARRML